MSQPSSATTPLLKKPTILVDATSPVPREEQIKRHIRELQFDMKPSGTRDTFDAFKKIEEEFGPVELGFQSNSSKSKLPDNVLLGSESPWLKVSELITFNRKALTEFISKVKQKKIDLDQVLELKRQKALKIVQADNKAKLSDRKLSFNELIKISGSDAKSELRKLAIMRRDALLKQTFDELKRGIASLSQLSTQDLGYLLEAREALRLASPSNDFG